MGFDPVHAGSAEPAEEEVIQVSRRKRRSKMSQYTWFTVYVEDAEEQRYNQNVQLIKMTDERG